MIILVIFIILFTQLLFSIHCFYNIRRFYYNKIIVDFILYILIISQLLFFITPVVLRLLSNWKYERLVDVSQIEVAHVYLIQCISFILWMTTILILSFLFKNKYNYSIYIIPIYNIYINLKGDGIRYYNSLVNNRDFAKKLANYSLIVILLNTIYLYNISVGLGPNFINSLDWLIYPFVMKSSKLFALLILFLGYKPFGIIRYSIVLLFSIYIYAHDLSDGSLGSIIAPASYIIFMFLFVKRNQIFKYIAVVGVIFVLLFYNQMHNMRTFDFKKGILERMNSILDSTQYETTTSNFNLMDKLNYRLGIPSKMSVGYIRMFDDDRGAGYHPIKNSLFAVTPRRFFKDKPVSGSLHGDKLSTGPHLINQEIEGALQNMSGHYAGAHFYWEAGYIGVFFLSVLSGIYSFILLNILDTLKSASLFFILVAHDTWWGTVELWVSEIIIQVITYMGPLLFFWYIYYFLSNIRQMKIKQ